MMLLLTSFLIATASPLHAQKNYETVRDCILRTGTTRIDSDFPFLDWKAKDASHDWLYLLENRKNGLLVWIRAYPENRLTLIFTVQRNLYIFVFKAIDDDPGVAWHGVCIMNPY